MESRSSILRDRALLGLEQFDFVTDFSDHRYRGKVKLTNKGLVLNEKPVYNEPVVSFRYKTWEGYNEDAFVLSCKTMLFLLQKPPKNFEALIVGHFRQNAVMILRACVAYKEDRVRIGFFNGDDDYDAPVSKKVSIRSFFFGQYQVSGRFKESIYKIYPKLFNAFSAIAAPNLQSMPEELETQMPEMPENSGVLKRIFCFSIFISAILVCFVAIYISYAGC
ncbi:Ubiquitin-conjugating enzyme/RWD-like protein [Corchorus olitorius]|uniref:Ubiquitin-conjugating enzyme/RWD-like protein n=1 Tax=Corchorus olitorius TaxID=93759 RepID=A0A1R3IWD5_9ROSI|nr:Ubiquitin-conjugating enzyme/RWD-like protein [Corchorus olitorius]